MAELVNCPNCGLDYEIYPELVGVALLCERCGCGFCVSRRLPDSVYMNTSGGVLLCPAARLEEMLESGELACDAVCLSPDGVNWMSYTELFDRMPLEVELLSRPASAPEPETAPPAPVFPEEPPAAETPVPEEEPDEYAEPEKPLRRVSSFAGFFMLFKGITSLLILLGLIAAFVIFMLYHTSGEVNDFITKEATVRSIMERAGREPDSRMVKLLLKTAVKADPADAVAELFQAVRSERADLVKLLLEAGVTPDAGTRTGMTVLVDAIGPPPSVLDPLTAPEGSGEWEKKRRELRIGESESKLAVIRALIAGGADVNLQSFYQNGQLVTPLGNAKEFRYRKIETMLREAGARD